MSLAGHSIEDEAVNSVVKLEVLQGGKQPPRQGSNWLDKLSLWTFFTVYCKKLSNVDAFMCQVFDKRHNSTFLKFVLPKEELCKWVVTENFSEEYILLDILEEGDDYNECNRSDTNGGLESVKDTEQINTMAGETE